jgi:hypothetical protein
VQDFKGGVVSQVHAWLVKRLLSFPSGWSRPDAPDAGDARFQTPTRNIRGFALCAAGLALLAAGCATYKRQAAEMTDAWRSGQVALAAHEFGVKAREKDKTMDSVVWHLEAGAACRAAGDYTNSDGQFDAAAAKMDAYEQQAKVKLGHEAGAIMSNQENLPYVGKPYDKIMLHTYKALNYLALGDQERARPEIIRAYQCQQDAVEENARRIEKAQEQEQSSKDKEKIEQTRSDPQFSAALGGVTKDLDGFKFYADYVNPFTVYLDGLFFLYDGSGGSDLEHAAKSLNRVREVCGENSFISADLQTVRGAMAGVPPGPCTYVIYETGRAASLDQVRIDVPILFANVSYVGAAFPKLVFHDDYAPELAIIANGVQQATTLLASMDSIVALDFKNEFPAIVTKTLISTVAKAAAAFAVNQAVSQQSDIGGFLTRLATAATQAAINIADTRSWTTLPKEFHLARLPTPADRKLTLSTGMGLPVVVNLMDGPVNVVYVKSITATSPLWVSQFQLGRPLTAGR